MLLATKRHTAGDTIRYEVDYTEWLEEGRTINKLAPFSATLQAPVGGTLPLDVSITSVSVTADRLYFFLSGGSANELFTVQVSIMDTLGEVVIDTINFLVVAP